VNTDIRLSIGFWDHPKTQKLERRLGLEGVKGLLVLWQWVAQYKPNGYLYGTDEEDIEIASRWNGEKGTFVRTLVELHFLDVVDGGYSIHDWEEHNPWAANAEQRADESRLAAVKRWDEELFNHLTEIGIKRLSKREYEYWKANKNMGTYTVPIGYPLDTHMVANAQGNAPVPVPIPNTEPNTEPPFFDGEPPIVNPPQKLQPLNDPDFAAKLDAAFDEFWEYYPKKQNRKQAKAAFSRLLFPALGRDRLNARKQNIVAQAIRYAKENEDTEQRYIKNPDNWLASIDPEEEVFVTVRYEREGEVV